MPIATEVTPLEENRVQLDVSVSHDEVERAVDRALRQLAREARIPGFRPGKVPPAVVMRRFGRDVVVQEMLKSSLGEWYESAVADAGVRPIDDPELDLDTVPEEGSDLVFRATVRTRPTATVGNYTGLQVPREEVEVPDGAVDAELDRLRQRAARLQVVERPAAAGDFVVISFEGRANGRRIASASARDYMVELGANRLLPDFDTALQGMSAGEDVTVEVGYADDDQRPELRGKTVAYTVSLQQVQEKVLPDLDDDLALEVSEFDTLDELRADIFEKLRARQQAEVDERFRRRVIDAAVAEATVEVPAVMIDRRINGILSQTANQLPRGVTFEQYLQATGRTLEQAVEELRPDAEMAIKRELVVEAVAQAEAIEITDADVEAQIRQDAESMGRDAEELAAEVRTGNAWETLREDLRLQRAVQTMVSTAEPISMEQAEAREKIWTPGEEKPEAGSKLWTPGQPT
jgi:trigger factor